jgi:phosphohistidine phosphatase SixA
MRHADAPGGTGDPPGFRLGDCASQRNLSAKGRADADRIGARLKAEGIVFERILASPWCRCMDTAAIMKMGMVEAEPAFSNVVVLSDQREKLTAAGRAIIDGWKEKGLLLVVTHGANIFALTGVSPASGEIVVIRSGSREAVGRLRLE